MSVEGLVGLLLIALATVGWALWRALASRRLLAAMTLELDRAEALGLEQSARLATLELLRDRQQLAEHAFATSTAVVKEMHKGIADIPFSVLEAIPGARAPARLLRGLHDSISDGVYGALGNLNRAVGRELRKGVEGEGFASTARAGVDRLALDGQAGGSSKTQGLTRDGKADDAPEPPSEADIRAEHSEVTPPQVVQPPKSWG